MDVHTKSEEDVEELNQTDDLIDRDRAYRWIVALGTPIATTLVGQALGGTILGIALAPISPGFGWDFGSTMGLIGGAGLGTWLFLKKSFVSNPAVTAFLTVDPVAAWFGWSAHKQKPTYGPGFHPAFWWEGRDGKNTVSLEEVTFTFTAKVVATDGIVSVKFEARLRANIRQIPVFIAGVASVGADIGSILQAKIMSKVKGKSTDEISNSVDDLNAYLADIFKAGSPETSNIEKRFGIILGDITIGEILGSDDQQKTLTGRFEMKAIADMMIDYLKRINGLSTIEDYNQAVKEGKITQNMIDDAMRHAKSVTGNVDGMKINENRTRFQLEGVTPEMVEALGSIGPSLAAFVAAMNTKGEKNG